MNDDDDDEHVLFIFSYFMMNSLLKKNSIYFSNFFLHDFIFLGQIKGQFNQID